MNSELYLDRVAEILLDLKEKSLPMINQAAQKIVDTVRAGKCVYFFGCTHAGILTQEVFYRTGGLAIMNPIFAPGLSVDTVPITMTSEIERMDGYGAIIAKQSGVVSGDLLFIHSVSGRNNVPIDLAIAVREMGAYVIAITSMAYSSASKSRHASGKRLYEVCDLVIDNGCPYGDSLIHLPNSHAGVAPGSTALGAVIVNAIAAQTASFFDECGQLPPVYASANIDQGEDYNQTVFKTYREQIHYRME